MKPIKIDIDIDPRWRTSRILSVEYPEFEMKEDMPAVAVGELLDSSEGFPFKLQRPQLSYKAFRAMYDCGYGNLANRVVTSKIRSTVTPDAVWKGVLAFGERLPKKPTTFLDEYQASLEWVRAQFTVTEKLKLLPIETAVKCVPQGTSPGLPFIKTHPGWKKGDIYGKYLPMFKRYWDRVGDHLPTMPMHDCAAFARSHISDYGVNKVRPVWAYPAGMIAQEARWSKPFTDALIAQKIGHNTAYGMEMMRGGMRWLNDNLIRIKFTRPGCKFLMTDYSGFDSHVPAWLIRDAFSIVIDQFDLTEDAEGNPLDEEKERRKFSRLVAYFINTPVRNMDGRRFLKKQGIPSGSMFTNLIDTIINLIVSYMASLVVFRRTPVFLNAFGDDAIMVFDESAIMDLEQLQSFLEYFFGFKLNLKKTRWTRRINQVHYLGYYNLMGDPVKTTEDLAASILYPQYNMDDWAYVLARAIGCAYASAGINYDIFHICRGILRKSLREGSDNVARAEELIHNNPRIQRHFTTMGCSDITVDAMSLLDIRNFMPRYNCSKLEMRIIPIV